MRERLPTLTAFVLLLILVIGTWWAANYTHTTVELDPPRRQTHEPDAWAKNFVMLRTDEQGVAINRLEGDFMQHFPDDDSYVLQKTIVTVHQNNNPATTARSDTAVMDQGGARVQMIGHAYIERQPDEKNSIFSISSPTLTLYPDQDTVQTEDFATVINGSHTLKGKGMYYDNNSRQLQVNKNTQVTLTPTNSPSR